MSWWSSESNPAGCTEQRLVVVFPVDQAVLAIDLPEGIKIGNEFASSRQQRPKHSDLRILFPFSGYESECDCPAQKFRVNGLPGGRGDPRIRLCRTQREHHGMLPIP